MHLQLEISNGKKHIKKVPLSLLFISVQASSLAKGFWSAPLPSWGAMRIRHPWLAKMQFKLRWNCWFWGVAVVYGQYLPLKNSSIQHNHPKTGKFFIVNLIRLMQNVMTNRIQRSEIYQTKCSYEWIYINSLSFTFMNISTITQTRYTQK